MGCLCGKPEISIEPVEIKADIPTGKWDFENLVIEGSATNGTVAIGAYKILEDTGITKQLKRYAGSSSGSMLATFASIHMTYVHMETEFLALDINIFEDESYGILRDTARIFSEYGLYKGDALENWVESILYKYTGINNITFQQIFDIYKSELHITRVNLSALCLEYLNHITTPDMSVSIAIRHSTSIPFLFKAPKTETGDIITDGGVGNIYPIDIFDTNGINKKTLGLKIISKKESKIKINSLVKYGEAFITFQSLLIEQLSIKSGYWERTIKLESPSRSIEDFTITRHDKMLDIFSGIKNTIDALNKYTISGSFC